MRKHARPELGLNEGLCAAGTCNLALDECLAVSVNAHTHTSLANILKPFAQMQVKTHTKMHPAIARGVCDDKYV